MSFYLTFLTFWPLLGALLLMTPLFGQEQRAMIKKFATGWAVIELLASLPLLMSVFGATSFMGINLAPQVISELGMTAGQRFRLIEAHQWIPELGVNYIMGVDAIAILMILLTNLLSVISLLSSWSAVTDREKEYYIWLLILHAGMVGVFCALDMFLFYVFWEVMLVPMYFLIGIWGGDKRLYSAIKFFLYTLAGSVLMLVAILAIYFKTDVGGGVHTFNYFQWLNAIPHAGFSPDALVWLFAAFGVAFAIKVPMFPVHTWLPDAHTDAPTAGSVILAGILLKMGCYGFLRFNLPFFPATTVQLLPVLLGLAIVGIIYGALCAMVQTDWKRLVAYSSVSHLGFVMLGIFSLNSIGLQGGVLQMINHGISTGALFLLVGVIYEQRHTRQLSEFGGLSQVVPNYATIFMIITMSSIGLPVLNGFVGELPIFMGAFQMNEEFTTLFGIPYLLPILAVSGVVLGAAYMLWLYQRTMFGKLTNEKNKTLRDLNAREYLYLMPLVLLCFGIGIYPAPLLRFIKADVEANVMHYTQEAMRGFPTSSEARTQLAVVEPEADSVKPAPAAVTATPAPGESSAATVAPAAVPHNN
jgi:NADH-quinone oxidoreductase subunit M